MPDVSTHLRTYFDETVERVTEEDVRIRATTEQGVRLPSPRFRPRPLAAGAIGFGLAMTLLGLVLVADRVFGARIADTRSGGAGGSVTTEAGSPWLFVPVVVIGFGLLATGIISTRLRNGDMRERGGSKMETIERVERVEAPLDHELTLKRRNRLLGWLSGILALAVVAMGAWLIMSNSSPSIPDGVQTALDEYLASWEANDAAAFIDATTTDYTFISQGQEFSQTAQAATIGLGRYFREEEVSDPTISGDGPYYVASAERVFTSETSEGFAGQSIMTVVEVDGTFKVSQHVWVGDL